MAVRIQLRRDTAANWVAANPVLRAGEAGVETDTLKVKIGNNSTAWNSLSYATVTPDDLTAALAAGSNTLYIDYDQKGVKGGVAEVDNDGNVLVPGPGFIIEGVTVDSYEVNLTTTDPTADRTITLPDATGTVALTSDITSAINAISTTDIEEGTNLYFTDERAQDAVGNVVGTGLSYNDTTGAISTNNIPNSSLQNSSVTINGYTIALGSSATYGTDNINEGTSNLYFTNERAQDAVGVMLTGNTETGIAVTYDDDNAKINFVVSDQFPSHTTTDLAEGTNLYFTDERAQDAVATALSNGTHTNITVTYNDSSNSISLNASGNVSSIAGTANQIAASSSTGAITLSLPSAVTFPGTVTLNADPSQALHAATKQYVDNAVEGLAWKAEVNLLANSNIALTGTSGTLVIDGHAALDDTDDGYRILLKNQTTGTENGIYTYTDDGSTYTLSRSTDGDVYTELIAASVYVLEGTVYGGTAWIQSNHYLSSFAGQNWVQFSGAGTVTAGTGISVNGLQVSIDTNTTVDKTTAQTLTNKTLTLPKVNEAVDLTATSTELNILDGATLSTAELNILDGVTASTAELNILDGVTASTSEINVLDGITASTAELNILDGVTADATELNILDGATLTTTELNYVDGVTSAIQTQLNAKASSSDLSTHTSASTGVHGVTGSVVGTSDTQTLTSKTISLTSNTLSGTTAEFNTALSDGDFATLAGTETLTNKTISGSNNTLSNIGNSSLTNSSITINGSPVSLGGTVTIDALPSQTGQSGKYLTTDGTTASWGTLVVPITTGTATITANTATTIDTNALSGFTSIEYMISLKQGSKIRTSKLIVQTDGTSVDSTEFAITETGGAMSGVSVTASVSSTDCIIQVTVTDAASTNVAVKFSEVKL